MTTAKTRAFLSFLRFPLFISHFCIVSFSLERAPVVLRYVRIVLRTTLPEPHKSISISLSLSLSLPLFLSPLVLISFFARDLLSDNQRLLPAATATLIFP
jgi:hypothetical protein